MPKILSKHSDMVASGFRGFAGSVPKGMPTDAELTTALSLLFDVDEFWTDRLKAAVCSVPWNNETPTMEDVGRLLLWVGEARRVLDDIVHDCEVIERSVVADWSDLARDGELCDYPHFGSHGYPLIDDDYIKWNARCAKEVEAA